MACCPPTGFCFCSHSKPPTLPFISNPRSKRISVTTLHVSPFHLHSQLSFSSKPLWPVSSLLKFSDADSLLTPSSQPIIPNPRSYAEKLAILVLGSLLFIARFNTRPAFALPSAPTNTVSVSLDEKADTQRGKLEDEGLYERILEKNPRDMEALKMVFYGKVRKGKLQEAAQCVDRMIELEPDEVEWMLLQALCFELSGELRKAKKVFKEILEERPLMLRALHGLAMVMHKNEEGMAVFEMLDRALELARREKRVTEERNIKILIAQMHLVKGDLEGASKQFQHLIKENPRDFRPYLCQGIVYSLLDKKKEADEQFEIYKSLVPDEFPQRGFMDDVILAAKTEPREQLKEGFASEISDRNADYENDMDLSNSAEKVKTRQRMLQW